MRRFLNPMMLLIGLLSLASCSPRRPAPVDEVGNKPHRSYIKSNSRESQHPQLTHKVVKGDSLYSIGFRYQKDYKTLAAINNIAPPYRIYPNQIIKLTGEPKTTVFKPTKDTTVQTQPIVSQQPIIAKSETIQPKSIQPPATQSKPTTKTTTKPVVAQTQPVVQTQPAAHNEPKPEPQNNSKPAAKKPVVVKTPTKTNLNWLWPTKGKIRTTFLASNPARKGISIGGQAGQPIKASEAGVVVYSGNGLLGYGELIIIKHNDSYLSAYGHNKSLKVREGQNVTRGQIIAELGSSGTNVNNLHFEIRKNGKPVNPLNYVKP